MIDTKALVTELQKLRVVLEDDLRARYDADADLDADLRAEWSAATGAGRTAEAYVPWRDARLTQAAVAWILACTFVRFCEDNDLVAPPRLGGPGERRHLAADHRGAYFRDHPADTDREWLRHVFGAVAALPAMGPLYDRDHNPIWHVPLTGDGATALCDFWGRIDADTGALAWDFTDPTWDTRFLGDLYQHLSEDARKRFALLQTPVFVEEFILDHTLTPAMDEFGHRDVTVIDPTVGSGHFLLGAFARLVAELETSEPGTAPRDRAQSVLDRLAGVDLNPFAIAICRFRLLLAAMAASGEKTLAAAPDFKMALAVGDALLHTPKSGQLPGFVDHDIAAEVGHVYTTEDADAIAAILGRKYQVVVGNPPYITVKDKALNDAYRRRYGSCHRKYALSAPFMERFFDLALNTDARCGYVGFITANSFMKREFGTKLVTEAIPKWDLTHVVDTSGAYIPGHGTPTVIIFGRPRRPTTSTVRAILGIRGEPSTPADPAQGKVWRSIVDNLGLPGTETDYVSVVDLPRERLHSHPWSLGGGGAADLAEKLSGSALESLGDLVDSIGFASFPGLDEAFISDIGVLRRRGVPDDMIRWFVFGECVRDWGESNALEALVPFQADLTPVDLDVDASWARHLWLFRTSLEGIVSFGGRTRKQNGDAWWTWYRWVPEKYRTPLSIAFAFVATHNHFVVDRGGKVFKQSAPVVKLAAGAGLDAHLGLAGLLNSAAACFWMQQVFHNKGRPGAESGGADERYEMRYEFDGTKLKQFPVPAGRPLGRATRLDSLAQSLAAHTPTAVCAAGTPTASALADAHAEYDRIRAEMIATQEELDWECAHLYGLTDTELTAPPECVPPLRLGERAFEIVLARRLAAGAVQTTWFERHGSEPVTDVPAHWPPEYRRVVEARIALIESDRDVGLVERPEYKRRWNTEAWDSQQQAALATWLLDRIEALALWRGGEIVSTGRVADVLAADADFVAVAQLQAGRADVDVAAVVTKLVTDEAVPFLAAHRYKDSGLRKRAVWEDTWARQRAEDRGEAVGEIAVPPKYTSADFAKTTYWRLRGKLDVSKERFVAYPGCGRRPDEVVVGWAGWDHLQSARALAALYIARRDTDGWDAAALTPLLAGLAELEPWLRQYHDDVDPAFGRRMGEYFAEFVDDRARDLGVTRAELGAWRPPHKGRRRKESET